MNSIKSLVLAFVAMVMLFGCATQDNPEMPVQDAQSLTPIQKDASPAPVLQNLPLPIWGRPRIVSTTQRINAAKGGSISVSYAYWTLTGKCSRDVTLTIPPGALDNDTDITMALDSAVVGVRFAPEGLVFNTPATLDYSCKGLDLSNVLAGTNFWLYWDSETGQFQVEAANKYQTNLFSGSISCTRGQIPHFSRYAFGR